MRSAPSTWRSRPPLERYSAPRPESIPIIVAEALVEVDDPVAASLAIGPPTAALLVANAIAASVAPVETEAVSPSWLRLDQRRSFRQALAAIEHHGAALLADPVGSGKSYVALAVAHHLSTTPTVVVVPASLMPQWRATAAALGVPIVTHSHEQLSRGRLPATGSRFVIVDESHRFRHAGIRRYRELARWMVGRQLLLLSATPIVNRLEDLGHQLLLGVRDDTLALAGVPSLRAMLARGTTHQSLGHLVLQRAVPIDRPVARHRMLVEREPRDARLLELIDRLELSRDGGTAALIRMTLWRALASSVRALRRSLERYLALLDHAAQADESGQVVTRARIRSFSSAGLDQLVLWELMPQSAAMADLVPGDRGALLSLLDLVRTTRDARLEAVEAVLRDRRPTLVFTGSRDTLAALRQLDIGRPMAWVTGAAAGIGQTAMPREKVLGWFRPTAGPGRGLVTAPWVLLATDVAAEGLDLQRAERIVHVDLPWTSVRVDQREGRALRLGNASASVEILRFAPWPALDGRVRQEERLLFKRRLGARAGLDIDGTWLYRWRNELPVGPVERGSGHAAVLSDRTGWLVGLALDCMLDDGRIQIRPADLLWLGDNGRVSDDPRELVPLLTGVHSDVIWQRDRCETGEALRARLAPVIRARLQSAFASQWQAREASGDRRRIEQRLRQSARAAAMRRDRKQLNQIDAALSWLSGGTTAGEELLLAELSGLSPARLLELLPTLMARPRAHPVGVARLTGALRFTIPP